MSMDDREIIELFFGRSEAAVSATEEKYGAYLRHLGKETSGKRDVCFATISRKKQRLSHPQLRLT